MKIIKSFTVIIVRIRINFCLERKRKKLVNSIEETQNLKKIFQSKIPVHLLCLGHFIVVTIVSVTRLPQ